MQITVALKKNEGVFEGALIIDQKFTRSASGKSAGDLFTKLAGALLVAQAADSEEIAFNVGFLTKAEVDRQERKIVRDREIAEATAEAEELEKLAAAKLRTQKAIDAQTPMIAAPVAPVEGTPSVA
jgi:hypothetical protein